VSPSQSLDASHLSRLVVDGLMFLATGSGLVEQAKNTVNSALGLSNKS
jgi:hypothetical protein